MCTQNVCLPVCPLSTKACPSCTEFAFCNPRQIDALFLVDRYSLNCHLYTVMRCRWGRAWAERAPQHACIRCHLALLLLHMLWSSDGNKAWMGGQLHSLHLVHGHPLFSEWFVSDYSHCCYSCWINIYFFEMTQVFTLFCFRVIPMTNIRMWWCRTRKSDVTTSTYLRIWRL